MVIVGQQMHDSFAEAIDDFVVSDMKMERGSARHRAHEVGRWRPGDPDVAAGLGGGDRFVGGEQVRVDVPRDDVDRPATSVVPGAPGTAEVIASWPATPSGTAKIASTPMPGMAAGVTTVRTTSPSWYS
jgi:hypothetical protein